MERQTMLLRQDTERIPSPTHVAITSHTGAFEPFAFDRPTFVLAKTSYLIDCRINGIEVGPRHTEQDSVGFIPAGITVEGEIRGTSHNAIISMDESLMTGAVQGDLDYSALKHRVMDVTSARISSLACAVKKIALNEELQQWPMLIESVSIALAAAVIPKLASGIGAVLKEREQGLSEARRNRVIQYINDNLHRQISLAELAGVAAISQFHFSRMFKRSMGVSPLAYVARQRIEKAKKLLRNASLSLVEVSIACGFCSQSHMTTVFKATLRVTPKQYRDSVLGALIAVAIANWFDCLPLIC